MTMKTTSTPSTIVILNAIVTATLSQIGADRRPTAARSKLADRTTSVFEVGDYGQ
jgi:hypothetical protein